MQTAATLEGSKMHQLHAHPAAVIAKYLQNQENTVSPNKWVSHFVLPAVFHPKAGDTCMWTMQSIESNCISPTILASLVIIPWMASMDICMKSLTWLPLLTRSVHVHKIRQNLCILCTTQTFHFSTPCAHRKKGTNSQDCRRTSQQAGVYLPCFPLLLHQQLLLQKIVSCWLSLLPAAR